MPKIVFFWLIPTVFCYFMAIFIYCAIQDVHILDITVQDRVFCEGLLLFFSMSILASVSTEMLIDKRARAKMPLSSVMAFPTVIGLFIGLFLLVNLFVNVSNKSVEDLLGKHLIFFTFAALLAITWKAQFVVTRQKLYRNG